MPKPTPDERKHIERVKMMPCLVCGYWPVDAHHVVGYADRIGRAPKRHDRITPLCHTGHHQFGPESVHGCGSHRKFYEIHGIDLMAVAVRLWEESNA